jgi:hypothetical protein
MNQTLAMSEIESLQKAEAMCDEAAAILAKACQRREEAEVEAADLMDRIVAAGHAMVAAAQSEADEIRAAASLVASAAERDADRAADLLRRTMAAVEKSVAEALHDREAAAEELRLARMLAATPTLIDLRPSMEGAAV